MIKITTYRNGLIIQKMTLLDEAEADLNGEWIAGHWDGNIYFVDNGTAYLRPLIEDIPETHSLALNTDWVLPFIPENSTILIDGDEVATVDLSDVTLSFESPGTYKLEIRPPFPWLSATCEVTVE